MLDETTSLRDDIEAAMETVASEENTSVETAAPQETTADDMAQVFGSAYDAGQSRRVQNILKALLKR